MLNTISSELTFGQKTSKRIIKKYVIRKKIIFLVMKILKAGIKSFPKKQNRWFIGTCCQVLLYITNINLNFRQLQLLIFVTLFSQEMQSCFSLLQVSVPPLCPPEDWRRLAELLLEGTGVGGVYLANKSVLSMYGGGRTTGKLFLS